MLERVYRSIAKPEQELALLVTCNDRMICYTLHEASFLIAKTVNHNVRHILTRLTRQSLTENHLRTYSAKKVAGRYTNQGMWRSSSSSSSASNQARNDDRKRYFFSSASPCQSRFLSSMPNLPTVCSDSSLILNQGVGIAEDIKQGSRSLAQN